MGQEVRFHRTQRWRKPDSNSWCPHDQRCSKASTVAPAIGLARGMVLRGFLPPRSRATSANSLQVFERCAWMAATLKEAAPEGDKYGSPQTALSLLRTEFRIPPPLPAGGRPDIRLHPICLVDRCGRRCRQEV